MAPPGGEEPAPPKAERAFEPPPSPGAGSKPANGSNKGAPKKPEPPRAASPAAAVGDKNPGLVDADRPNAGSTDPVDDLDIDLDLKIDDNFDLGEDLDEPDQPPRDGGRPEA